MLVPNPRDYLYKGISQVIERFSYTKVMDWLLYMARQAVCFKTERLNNMVTKPSLSFTPRRANYHEYNGISQYNSSVTL